MAGPCKEGFSKLLAAFRSGIASLYSFLYLFIYSELEPLLLPLFSAFLDRVVWQKKFFDHAHCEDLTLK